MTRSDASTRRADNYTEVLMGGLGRTGQAYEMKRIVTGFPLSRAAGVRVGEGARE